MQSFTSSSLRIFAGMSFFCLMLCTFSCEKYIFGVEYTNEPEDNFESLWSEFDQMYGLFKVRNVDWEAVYDQYRPLVSPSTSDEELYQVLVDMLGVLDDGHVILLPVGTGLPMYTGGPIGRIDTIQDFDIDILKENYLENPRETDFALLYGWLEDSIGYLHIYNFADGERAFEKEMEPVMEYFENASGLVVDIRGGGGGEDIAGKTIASYFTSQRRLYMTTSIKNGPGPDDFTTPEQWFISPKGDQPFTRPVVLLTNRLTISARETFALAMRTLPQVSSIGDTTAGAFSNLVLREMPNGWGYSMSIGDWRAADGTSFEGIGLPPDELIQNKRSDLLNGKDEVLERALELLR